MKSKYFARGFGVGVLVTSLVFAGVSLVRTNTTKVLPDQSQNGTIVSDNDLNQDKEQKTQQPDVSKQPGAVATESAAPAQTPVPSPSAGTAAPEQNASPTPAGTVAEKKPVSVEIARGDDSYDVAKKLEQQGLIDDAKEFNVYLEQRGYEQRLQAGTYQVNQGDTYEQIAQKITDREK